MKLEHTHGHQVAQLPGCLEGAGRNMTVREYLNVARRSR